MATDAPTSHDRELLTLIETFAGFMGEHQQSVNVYDDVVREGRSYKPRPLADDWMRGLPRYCFDNSVEVAEEYGLAYVEGYALSAAGLFMPIKHAWNATRDGVVVDVTWNPVGLAYRGIEFDLDHARAARAAEMTALTFR